MINRVVLVGRITKDPVLKKTQANNSVVSFTLACNRNIKNETGEYDADFINCVAWNTRADVLSKYASKGSMIGLDGSIQTRSYDDQSGKRVYVTEVLVDHVQLIDTKTSPQGNEINQGYSYNQNTNYAYPSSQMEPHRADYGYSNQSDTIDISSDDLPF